MVERMLMVLVLIAAFAAPVNADLEYKAVADPVSRSPFENLDSNGNYGWGSSYHHHLGDCDPLWNRGLGVPVKLEVEAAKERLLINRYANPYSAGNQVLAAKERLLSNRYENPDSASHQVQLARERLWANKYTNPSSAAWQVQAARERLWTRTKAFHAHNFEKCAPAEALWFNSYRDSASSDESIAQQEAISESREARSPWGDSAVDDRFSLWKDEMQGTEENEVQGAGEMVGTEEPV